MGVTESQPERARNKTIRRADWRFLLPDPRPGASVCFSDGLLAAAVASISDRVIAGERAVDDQCDLAVATNPAQDTLRAAWAALHPGGSCYTEWYRPLSGGAKGVRRRLEAVGFDDVTCYWAWPWPSRASALFWLPLGAPNALRYFAANRPKSRLFVGRLARGVREALWALSVGTNLALPVCAVARKPPRPDDPESVAAPRVSPGERDMNHSPLSMIRARWPTWDFGPTPSTLSLLLLTGGPRSISKIVALVFADSEREPALAVKMARVPESVPALAREAATLRALQVLQPDRRRGVPRVLFCDEHAGLLAVGETALTGVPLSTIVGEANYRDIALKATGWLADFAGRPGPAAPSNWWDRLVEPLLADFGDAFGPVVDRAMLNETRAILSALGPLPLVCEHRDFSPWNVLMDATGELVVLDWESSEREGLPALDLVYFLAYLSFFVDGSMRSGHLRESYRASLDPTTRAGSVRRECLRRYAGQTGIDPAALKPLCLLVWLLHSRSEYGQFLADTAGKPTEAQLRHSAFLGLWEEELRSNVNHPGRMS